MDTQLQIEKVKVEGEAKVKLLQAETDSQVRILEAKAKLAPAAQAIFAFADNLPSVAGTLMGVIVVTFLLSVIGLMVLKLIEAWIH